MLLNTWATFFYFFTQWLLTIVVTRVGGYEKTGIFTLAVSFTNIFKMLALFGMRSFQVSDVEMAYSNGQYFTSRLITTGFSLLPFTVALLFCHYRPEITISCIAMMFYKLLESMDDVMLGTMQRYHRYDWIAISYTAKGLLTVISFSMLLHLGEPLPFCILSMALAYFSVQLFFDLPHLRNAGLFALSVRGLKTLLLKCLPLVIAVILDAVLIYLPRNAVEKICGSELLGYYGTISIVVVVLSTLGSAVWGSLISRFSLLIHNKLWNKLLRYLRNTAIFLLALSLIAFFAGNALGPMFFRLLFGESILKHMDILPLVLLNAILLLVNSFFQCVFVPMGKRELMTVSSAAAVLSCAVIVNQFTMTHGLKGACGSLTAALVIRLMIQLLAMWIVISIGKKTGSVC